MRIALFAAGIILIALGIWVALGKLTYKNTDTAAKFGPVSVQTTTDKVVPAPLGYLGIVVGAGLVIAGALKK
jgi:hypothetical protein